MKKNLIILFLVLSLLMCCTAVVCAQTSAEELLNKYRSEAALPESEIMFESEAYITLNTDGQKIWRAPFAGIFEFTVPEEWIAAKGGIRAILGSEIDDGVGVVELVVNYITSEEPPYKELVRVIEETEDENIYGQLYDQWASMLTEIFSVYGISENRDENALRDALKDIYVGFGADEESARLLIDQMQITKIGSADDFNFFLAQNEDEDLSALENADEEYKKEYDEFSSDISKYIPNFRQLGRPMGLTEIIDTGTGISFATKDIHGNPVETRDVFGRQKVTMVNIWSTTCGFCISELPELVKMNKEFEAKGAQIVGIVYDAMDDDVIKDAKDIVDDLHVDYVTLLPTNEIKELFKVQAFPCTYFVNDRGEVLGEPIFGVALSEFPALLDKYLADAK